MTIVDLAAVGERQVRVGRRLDPEGRPVAFTLVLGEEKVELEPGKPWIRADVFKWTTRGCIEEPQSFHVLADGTVEINGERMRLGDADGEERLARELNKRHVAPPARRAAAVLERPLLDHVVFKVRLDSLGHIGVECVHGSDSTETGLRGLPVLVHQGLMRPPRELHVDPLQRWVELDGDRYDCSEEGARRLEQVLNSRYAPRLACLEEGTIEVRENDASPTGFDLHFRAVQGGTRTEVRGHLGQDKLDLLQDRHRCDLLQAGILLRLSPPYLLVRRKRPDGGEERVAGIADVMYRRATASELQLVLNHPLVRRGGAVQKPAEVRPVELAAAAVVPLQEAEEVEPTAVEEGSSGEGEVATTAEPPADEGEGAELERPAVELQGGGAEVEDEFPGKGSSEVNRAIFARLSECAGVEVQTVYFSLPRVFENRQFDVLAFDGTRVEELGDLRSGSFHGFYLSHHGGGGLDLVYANGGRHVEWGPRKCVLQASLESEPEEFEGAGLLGLAQDAEERFVFVVTEEYRGWVRAWEGQYARAGVRFAGRVELAGLGPGLVRIWPAA